jgi:uncharacterized protein YbbC (DUF1343 family)
LAAVGDLQLTAAFGPQHGLRGDKQDNMVESPEYVDPSHGIPVHSLYGEVRRPTPAMMDEFDVLLVDLQDLGCRIYTFITTLRYVLEEAARHSRAVWVLDRPNPIGRPVEGLRLRDGWESFVGAGPLPMRHGLTLGELGAWFIERLNLDVEYRVLEMEGWRPDAAPGFGWPLGEARLGQPQPECARTRDGALLPGHGDARRHHAFRRARHDPAAGGLWRARPRSGQAPRRDAEAGSRWTAGCRLRTWWFEPTFHKHSGRLCAGVQIHAEDPVYDHTAFRPWRLQAVAFKALRRLRRTMPCGAIFTTNTNTTGWPST